MKHIFPILLCLCLLLSACSSEPQPATPTTEAPATTPTTLSTTAPTAEPTTAPATEATQATEPATVPTTVPPVLYAHPLTGQLMEEPLTTRPVAVIINNLYAAQPLMGVGSADVLFEHIAEGGGTITRFLACFTDLEGAGTIGSIRSARTYLLDLARTFDAPIVHCGYSSYAENNIRQTGYPSFNEFFYGKYFYRDQDRLSAGYATEHTLMIEAEDLYRGLRESKFDMTVPADTYYGMDFADNVMLEGTDSQSITVRFFSPEGKTTTMAYNPADGMYYGTQQWSKRQVSLADGNTGDQVPFKNVLILNALVWYAEDYYHVFTEMTGEGTGYFACNGKYVPIKWYRETTADPFTYTLEDGTPLTFGIGKTYIAIRPTCSPEVIFE